MTRYTEIILVGGNPSKNQTFSGVSETLQSIWDKHSVICFFFFSSQQEHPGKLNPNKIIKSMAVFAAECNP